MTPQRIANLQMDVAAPAVGALTLSSVLLELVAPVNLILVVGFIASIIANFMAGTFRSFAEHRRAGRTDKWFSASKATFGLMKKFALMLFVPLAAIIDGMTMAAGDVFGGDVGSAASALGAMTPTMKGVLCAMAFAQVVGAARSLHHALGDEAVPGLAAIIRAVDRANVDGEPPSRRAIDPIVDAHLDGGA